LSKLKIWSATRYYKYRPIVITDINGLTIDYREEQPTYLRQSMIMHEDEWG